MLMCIAIKNKRNKFYLNRFHKKKCPNDYKKTFCMYLNIYRVGNKFCETLF